MYKNNATLGVGKLDYIIASGTEQKNIQDVFNLESYLHLDEISPMQTSYTQAPEDRDAAAGDDDPSSGTSKTKESQSPSPSSSKSAASGIEPSDDGGGGEEKGDSSSSSTRNTDAKGTTHHGD